MPCKRMSAPTRDAGELFSRLHREIVPKRGLCVDYDRPFVAIYLNDPAVTREVHRRTELCVPVLPVRMPFSSNDDEEARGGARGRPMRLRAGSGLGRSSRPRDASPLS